MNSVAFSPAGNLVASAGDDKIVRVSRVSDGKLARELRAHTRAVNGIAFSRDGSLLATAGADGVIVLWGIPK